MLSQFPALAPFAELDANWRAILSDETRAIVYCWAIWSPVDRSFSAILARIFPDYEKQFRLFTANLDDETLLPFFTELNVVSCPFLLLCNQGRETGRSYGYMNDERLRVQLDDWLKI